MRWPGKVLPLTLLLLQAALLLLLGIPCGGGGGLAYGFELLPPESPVRIGVSGLVDVETYVTDAPAPGLLFSDDGVFLNPRGTLFLDVNLGSHVYAFVQARVDRGFDPGVVEEGDVRLDEYFVRWTPLDSPALNVQVGKFATVFGNWAPRHLSWENPFINAPVPYENVLGITDQAAPLSREAFLNRRRIPDKKREWLPMLWGPSYAHGVSVSGRLEELDYAFEVKHASISSRPSAWEAREVDWEEPTFTGRLGWRPDAAWNLGASFSTGAYLLPEGDRSRDLLLPKGTDRGDFSQDTLGLDFSYAHRRLEVWSEVMLSRFEVPRVGDVSTLAYYIEAKYKLTESLFLASRWNQQFCDEVADGRGGEVDWDRELFRADLSLGYRFTRNLQTKLQYSYGHERGPGANADHLLAAQVTLKF